MATPYSNTAQQDPMSIILGGGGPGSGSPFDASQYQTYDPNKMSGLGQVQSAQGGQVDPAFMAAQKGLVSSLQNQANGGGPNLAGAQLAQAQDQNAKQALALAASTRGNQNPGMAMQAAQQSLGASNQAAAGQATQARLEQQMAAQGMLGNVAAQGGQASLGQAQLGQQAGQFNAGQYNNQLANAMNLQGQMAQQQNTGIQNASLQQQQANNALRQATFGGMANAAQGAATEGLQLAMLAQGGIVNMPTKAIVGEAGPEAVIPLHGHNGIDSVPQSALLASLSDMHSRLSALEHASRHRMG